MATVAQICRQIGWTRKEADLNHREYLRSTGRVPTRTAIARADETVVTAVCGNLGLDRKQFEERHALLFGGAPGSEPFPKTQRGLAPGSGPFNGDPSNSPEGSREFGEPRGGVPGSDPFPGRRSSSPFEDRPAEDQEEFSQDVKKIARMAGVTPAELVRRTREDRKRAAELG